MLGFFRAFFYCEGTSFLSVCVSIDIFDTFVDTRTSSYSEVGLTKVDQNFNLFIHRHCERSEAIKSLFNHCWNTGLPRKSKIFSQWQWLF